MSFGKLSRWFLLLSMTAAPLSGAGCTNLPGLGGQGTGVGSTAGGQVGEEAGTLAGQSAADEEAGSHLGGQADR